MREEERSKQERSANLSQHIGDTREWLTSQIDALESYDQIKGEKRPTLDLTWMLGVYRLARDYLDAFDLSRTMLHEMKASVVPLERRVAALESGMSLSEMKIPINSNASPSISKLTLNAESMDHLTNSSTKLGKKENILPEFEGKN